MKSGKARRKMFSRRARYRCRYVATPIPEGKQGNYVQRSAPPRRPPPHHRRHSAPPVYPAGVPHGEKESSCDLSPGGTLYILLEIIIT